MKAEGNGYYGLLEKAGTKNGNNIDWQFWQQHNKPIEIIDQAMFDKHWITFMRILYRQVL